MSPNTVNASRAARASEPPLVSIVVLSFNRPALLETSLASVLAQSYPNTEIIVIDNLSASSPEIARILQKYPHVTFRANVENRGFTGGMNQGFELARGEYVHFTEDDIALDPSCIERLVEHMDSHPEVALSSGLMLEPDGTICCAGGSVVLDGVYRVEILRGDAALERSRALKPYEVSFVPGAFILARRDVIQRIGAFNEDFFLYFDDTELCVRIRRAGHKIMVVPAARGVHAPRPPGPSPDYVEFHRQKNFVAIYMLHAPWSAMPEFLLRNVILSELRTVRSNRSRFRIHLAAYRWVVEHLTKLWRERQRLERLIRQEAGGRRFDGRMD